MALRGMSDRDLIRFLLNALELTKSDAERNGFTFGRQSTCNLAIDAAKKRLREHDEKRRLSTP